MCSRFSMGLSTDTAWTRRKGKASQRREERRKAEHTSSTGFLATRVTVMKMHRRMSGAGQSIARYAHSFLNMNAIPVAVVANGAGFGWVPRAWQTINV